MDVKKTNWVKRPINHDRKANDLLCDGSLNQSTVINTGNCTQTCCGAFLAACYIVSELLSTSGTVKNRCPIT